MKIGVITITYNSKIVMHDFLSSLFAQTYTNWHLYIYENGSPNKIDHVLNDYTPDKYTYIDLCQNLGFAKANNLAIQQAFKDNCDCILLINNDTIFDINLFQGLFDKLNQHNALVIAPKMLYYPEKNIVWYGGGYFDARQALKNVHIGIGKFDDGSYNASSWQDFAPMCCVLITKDAIKINGYLDEDYFIYYEDADWMYRLKLKNIQVWYEPSLVLYHKVSSLTGGVNSSFAIYHATQGKILFIKKFYRGYKKYYWLSKYFLGFAFGILLGRYGIIEGKYKFKAFFDIIMTNNSGYYKK